MRAKERTEDYFVNTCTYYIFVNSVEKKISVWIILL